jgi:hypothetical protein
MDGETVTIGNEAASIRRLRTFSYDAANDDWLQLGKDLKDSSFLFGHFSLSTNGKVLVTTTQKVDLIRLDSSLVGIFGQVRTWDFIANNGAAGGGGEWIQRGAALEVGTPNSGFASQIALSEDGNRLATSAIYAQSEQCSHWCGKVRVFLSNNIE